MKGGPKLAGKAGINIPSSRSSNACNLNFEKPVPYLRWLDDRIEEIAAPSCMMQFLFSKVYCECDILTARERLVTS